MRCYAAHEDFARGPGMLLTKLYATNYTSMLLTKLYATNYTSMLLTAVNSIPVPHAKSAPLRI
jgi:hypothetical protein